MKLTTFMHAELFKNLPPARRFNAILIDPPWKYNDRINDHSRGAVNHYDTLDINQIAAFPAEDYTSDDCILFMWATKDFRADAEMLFGKFGFIFKTEFIWVKIKKGTLIPVLDTGDFPAIDADELRIGMGHYNRLCHEHLLVGIKKGSKTRLKNGSREASVFFAPISKHSKKPVLAYELVERNAEPPYLEVFARNTRTNWVSWGNEV